jgi:hypothetical protein
MLIGRLNHFGIAHAAPRLNHASCTGSDNHVESIAKWKEGIARNSRPF